MRKMKLLHCYVYQHYNVKKNNPLLFINGAKMEEYVPHINTDQNKRERKRNFSTDEIRILIEEFENHKDVLESKFTNTVTNARKNKIWQSIGEKINSLGHEKRTLAEIKAKWKNICSSAKLSWNDFKKKRKITGGGPAPKPLSAEELHVVEIFQGQPKFEGLVGYSSFHTESLTSTSNVNPTSASESVVPTSSLETSILSDTAVENVTAPKTKSFNGKGKHRKKRKVFNDVTNVQIQTLKRESVLQKWKLKNLKLVNQKLLCDIKNVHRESELLDLQKSKLELELTILQTNLSTIIGNSMGEV